jgi:hypothetical protein
LELAPIKKLVVSYLLLNSKWKSDHQIGAFNPSMVGNNSWTRSSGRRLHHSSNSHLFCVCGGLIISTPTFKCEKFCVLRTAKFFGNYGRKFYRCKKLKVVAYYYAIDLKYFLFKIFGYRKFCYSFCVIFIFFSNSNSSYSAIYL